MRASVERAKTRARTIGSGPTFRDNLASVKDGRLFIDEFVVPGIDVKPGGTVDVRVTVSNGGNNIQGAGNPDCCGPFCGLPGQWSSNGYQYTLIVKPEWSGAEERSECLGGTEIGVNSTEWSFSFVAPETEGGHNINAQLHVTDEASEVNRAIHVDAEGEDRPGPGVCNTDSDCPEGEVCVDGTCVPEEEDDSGFPIELAIVIFVLVIFGGIAVSQLRED